MTKRLYKNAIVRCGDFCWRGRASSVDDAIIGALAVDLPINPSILMRVKLAGGVWHYISFESALRIAGHKVRKTSVGFTVVFNKRSTPHDDVRPVNRSR